MIRVAVKTNFFLNEIALSGDELDTIVEGASEVQEEPTLSPKTEEVIPDLSEPSTDEFFSNDKSSGEDEEIALSGDELDTIVEGVSEIQEEPTLSPKTEEVIPDLSEPSTDEFFSNDKSSGEDEEIALSGDELDTIVEGVSEIQEEPTLSPKTEEVIPDLSEPSTDEFFSNDKSSGEDEEIALSGDELDTIVEGVSEIQEEPTLSPKTEEVIPDLSEPSTDDFFLNDKSSGEDEEIALSGDELDTIVEGVSEVQEEPTLSPKTEEVIPDLSEPSTDEFFSNDESSGEDEEIALSGDELDTIVEGVSEVQEEPTLSPKTEEVIPDLSEPSTDEFFSNDESSGEDEEIALSGDELDTIVEGVSEVQEEPTLPPKTEEVVPDLSEPSTDEFFSNDESSGEDEEIALSGDELDTIVEGVSEVQEEPTLSPKTEEVVPDLSEPSTDEFFSNDESSGEDKSDEDFKHTIPSLLELQPELSIAEYEKVAGKEQDSKYTSSEKKISSSRLDRLVTLEENSDLDREEMRKMISYLDNLLGDLPDNVIKQFAQSEYFALYKKVINQLGI